MTETTETKIDRKARLKIPFQPVPKQDPKERVKNWDEVYLGYDLATAKLEATRCIQCPAAPCIKACPLDNDIPGALLKLEEGDLLGAAIDADKAIVVLVKARGAEHPVVIRARTLRAQIALALGDEQTAFDQAQQASTALARYTRYTFGAISDRQRSLLAEDAQDVVGALLSAESAPP
ncbi:MAG: hypothetical protein IH797_06760, partial [Chloroflexi bacterium]|nr:hypothetical protein [Chloroflexota bacterium]